MTTGAELGTKLGSARKEPQLQLSTWSPSQDLSQDSRGVVVSHHQEVAWAGVQKYPGMPQIGMDDPVLVPLVVVHPEFEARLRPHRTKILPLTGKPGVQEA